MRLENWKKQKTDNNTSLTYSYNETGQLTLVTDHTGRSVELSKKKTDVVGGTVAT